MLFPDAVLPLHIFEPRYRAMLRYALDHDRLIAMALIRPGHSAAGLEPPLHEVVCVGQVISHEPCPDGRADILLMGLSRARLGETRLAEQGFRLARLSTIGRPTAIASARAAGLQQKLLGLLRGPGYCESPPAMQIAAHYAGKDELEALCNLICFHLIPDPCAQQLLLEMDSPLTVAEALIELLAAIAHEQPVPGRPLRPSTAWLN